MAEQKRTKPADCSRTYTCFVYSTPIGQVTIESDGTAITAVRFGNSAHTTLCRTELTDRAASQISEYLCGIRTCFNLPLRAEGTAFQKRVWNALLTIAYGETRSYRQIAEQIGNPNAVRAVGMANNRNPLPLLIPCHRVIGADGSLVGYTAGLEIKKQLLKLEQAGAKPEFHPEPGIRPIDQIIPYRRRAHYYETDQMGIVHHSNYIRWMEEARLDFLEQLGWGYRQLEQSGLLIPVTGVSCTYRSPVRFGDSVVIDVRIADYRGARLALDYRITDPDTGKQKAAGKSEHCFCNTQGRPIRLKKFSEALDHLFSALSSSEKLP